MSVRVWLKKTVDYGSHFCDLQVEKVYTTETDIYCSTRLPVRRNLLCCRRTYSAKEISPYTVLSAFDSVTYVQERRVCSASETSISLVQTIIWPRPLCDEYKKYTLIEWERCVFAKCRAPLKNATQCLSPRLSPVEKNSGGKEGYDDFGATTKQPSPRATLKLKRLCHLRMLHASVVSNSNGFWLKHIMVVAPARARSSART